MSGQPEGATAARSAGVLDRIQPARWHLVAIVALAVVIRWIAWSNAVMMFNDGPDFLWQARMMLDGRWLEALEHQYHPLYAFVVSSLARLGPDLASAAAWTSILSGGLLAAGVFGMARLLVPDHYPVALLAGLWAAIHTRAVRYGADVGSDGLMMGLAFLTRPEALILGVPLGLWVLAGARDRPEFARRLGSSLVFGAGVMLAVAPFVLAIHELTGGWGLSMHSQLRAFGLTPAGVELGFHPESPFASPRLGPNIALVQGGVSLGWRPWRRASTIWSVACAWTSRSSGPWVPS